MPALTLTLLMALTTLGAAPELAASLDSAEGGEDTRAGAVSAQGASLYRSPLGASNAKTTDTRQAGQPRRTAAPRRPVRRPVRRPTQRPRKKRNAVLGCFWTAFKPPGPYSLVLGFSGGANFLETAYSGSNPNLLLRLQADFRPDPTTPFHLYGVLDHSSYTQDAGPLEYTSRQLMLGAGGSVHHWIGPMRLELGLEAGALNRISSQTDGKSSFTNFSISPAASALGGGSLLIAGHVGLTIKGGVRAYPAGRFDGLRTDYMVLYGVEWVLDARPPRVY